MDFSVIGSTERHICMCLGFILGNIIKIVDILLVASMTIHLMMTVNINDVITAFIIPAITTVFTNT